MPTQIKESMVLWYDIARQGCTNENMAENPVLRDLSGNGHDATCYNFAWSGMSGMGGYDYYAGSSNQFRNNGGIVTYSADHAKAVVTNTGNNTKGAYNFWQYNVESQIQISIKIKIIGISDSGLTIFWHNLEIQEDGEYFFEYKNGFDASKWVGLRFDDSQNNQSCNITIEQLPLYPHALVSDGIDDYAEVTNLPVLDDWTVFIEKDIIKYPASGWPLVDGGNDAYSTLQYKYEEASKFYINSFGVSTNVTNHIEKLDIFTPTSFNGNSIQKGDRQAKRTRLLLSGGNQLPTIPMVLYSLIVFNRTLTPEEIEWVKRNLM